MGIVFYVATNIQVVVTESVDAHIVWPSERDPELGDLVSFKLTHRVIPTPDNSVQAVKILTCTQGQYLRKHQGMWSCDGKNIGMSRTYAMNGDKLDQFAFNGPVPKGKGFVTGTNKHTFDSRYWGFVDLSSLTTVDKVF